MARCADDDWALLAWRGQPGVLVRPEPLAGEVTETPLPVATADLAPVTDGSRPTWLLLAEDGQIGRFDAGSGEWDLLAIVIHRTDWNRLDISDAATGELLSGRERTRYGQGEPRPSHYLDYFHGGLLLSPGGRWIADDGWVWHPVGVPTVWDAQAWLGDNVWESEDGPSQRALCHRGYYWDTPMCWTGENQLAVSGIGSDDEAMLAGVRIFDVAAGAQVAAFAGPTGALFAAGGRLYSAAADGLEAWDPRTGQRTGTVPGFVPARHHPAAGELAGISGAVLRRWPCG